MLRPALVFLLAVSGAGCSMVEGDPHRFEKLAQGIADIPVDGRPVASRTAAEAGLRPALRVEVLDPHALWDARDGVARQAIQNAAPAIVETAAPVLAQAVAGQVDRRVADASARVDGLRPPLAVDATRRTLQLGAYSTETAAETAWRALSTGAARSVLSDLEPRFEQAEVKGRSVVRLKVSTPSDRVDTLCRTTRIDAPWCVSAG